MFNDNKDIKYINAKIWNTLIQTYEIHKEMHKLIDLCTFK